MLLIIFFVQVIKGYIYSYISLFTSIFFSGAILAVLVLKKFRRLKVLFFSELTIIILFISILIITLSEKSLFILYIISFILGFMTSLEFNFIAKTYSLDEKSSIKKISAQLNIYDLLGSTFGGIFLVGLLLPVKGVYEIINFVMMIKFISTIFCIIKF
jgi:hypothetical protein